MAQSTDSEQRSRDYVSNLADDCVRTDGYACVASEESDFLSVAAEQAMLPGNYLEAWSRSYVDFQTLEELNAEQKRLKHYRIGFTEDEANYIVLFRALLLPRVDAQGIVDGVLRVSIGMTTKYWVDKKTFAIAKRLFLR